MLNNIDKAPIGEPLRAMLALLRKVTRAHDTVTSDDMRALLNLGVTREQIEDALDVAFAFNVITRLADTFNFAVGTPASFDAAARMLLGRGYR